MTLNDSSTTADVRICFVGDSFVNGVGDEAALGWAGRLCVAANSNGNAITYYNLGIRRNTSRDILARIKAECSLRLPANCDGRIVVSCGVNDSVVESGNVRVSCAESVDNIREILIFAKQYKAILVGPPPVGDRDQLDRLQQISREFERVADSLDVPFIELFSHLVSDRNYVNEIATNDGAHPKSIGYSKIAGIVATSPCWWFR